MQTEADSVVRELRLSKSYPHDPSVFDRAASMIESLQAQLAAKVAEIANLREAQRWIPVSERLPETVDGGWIAFQMPSYFRPEVLLLGVARYFSASGWCCKEVARATYWMPLPNAPGEGEME